MLTYNQNQRIKAYSHVELKKRNTYLLRNDLLTVKNG